MAPIDSTLRALPRVNDTRTRVAAQETPPPDGGGNTPAAVDDMPNVDPIKGFWEHAGRGWEHTQMIVGDHVRETVIERPTTTFATIAAVDGTAAALIAASKTKDLSLTGRQFAGVTGKEMALNGLRITPTLAAGVLGPAVADGVSYLAPNLVPKYKKTMSAGEQSSVKIKRAVAGGIAVGALAGVVYLIRPQLFRGLGANLISDKAFKGYTKVVDAAGQHHTLIGKLDDLPRGATVLKQGAAMTKDAAFSNRVLLGLVGGGATAYLANRAVMADDETRGKWAIAAAATGVATLGGIGLAGALTKSAANVNGILPDAALFWKPNKQFFKELAVKVVVPTGGTAAGAAFNYFDIFNDFEKIVDARSPYRK